MATTVSNVIITDPAYIHLTDDQRKALGSIHNPRKIGQGYATVEDVLEFLSDKKTAALEDYVENIENGMEHEEAYALLSDKEKAYFTKIRKWIRKYSNLTDDHIRSKYSVPFPDAPYAPQVLNQIVAYFVNHAIYAFEGGHIGTVEEDGQPTYHDYAMKLIRDIVEGRIHLETRYQLPVVDEDGKVIGEEVVKIGITGDVMDQHFTENPMSIANQEDEFGYAVKSWHGGSGYRQHGRLSDRGDRRDGRSEDYS